MKLLLLLLCCCLSPHASASAAAPSVASAQDSRGHPAQPSVDSAALALDALAAHQRAPGYWTTAFTDDARFGKPTLELNTFTNAIMIALLDPIAEDARIGALVGRARAFLTDQIEADGLVRYHGRPDLRRDPAIWTCVITPDTDDTALVWRIAPSANRELLPAALATLARFRSASGLYKTWLAPQHRYQCIDPGRDPNPTDIGIQMNLLMLLAQVDRPAARELCAALRKESSDDKTWVYYARAPLIPTLRLADLEKLECPLRFAQARSRTDVQGQEMWMEVAHLLGRMERAQATSADYSRARDLLRDLAADGFQRVASAPPLLYHNDFTGRVRRFYWSEDVGYALWLRLDFASRRAAPRSREAAPT